MTAFVPGAAGRGGAAVARRRRRQWPASFNCGQTCVSPAERGTISRRGYARETLLLSPPLPPPSRALSRCCARVSLSYSPPPPSPLRPSVAICHPLVLAACVSSRVCRRLSAARKTFRPRDARGSPGWSALGAAPASHGPACAPRRERRHDHRHAVAKRVVVATATSAAALAGGGPVRACVRACIRARARACVRAYVRAPREHRLRRGVTRRTADLTWERPRPRLPRVASPRPAGPASSWRQPRRRCVMRRLAAECD